jgi:hypothetical protein
MLYRYNSFVCLLSKSGFKLESEFQSQIDYNFESRMRIVRNRSFNDCGFYNVARANLIQNKINRNCFDL